MPKVNMYQSLHTTVIGPKGDPVEIQIRTVGDAPHRRGGHRGPLALQGEEERPGQVRRRLHVAAPAAGDRRRTPKDPQEFLDTVRVDLFPDEVYVFTPKGDVKALPEGATPIDFAYAVHTDVGEPLRGRQGERQARAAALHAPAGRHRRDRHLARTSTRAATGSRSSSPPARAPRSTSGSRSRSAPARSSSGREMFEREAKKYRLTPGDAARRRRDEEASSPSSASRRPTTCWPPSATARPRCSRSWTSWRPRRHAGAGRAAAEPAGRHPAASSRRQGVRIRGVDDLLVRFAKCCTPVPGDGIVGFITRGRGLTVHARDCLTVVKSVLDQRAAHRRGVGRGGAGQAAGPDRRLHRAATARVSWPRSPAPSPPATATSPRPR